MPPDDTRSGSPHWQFTTTVPYSAGGLTAEWIVESPLLIGSGGANQIALSNFGSVPFVGLTANNSNLTPSEAITLVNSKGAILAEPSAPGSSGDSFSVCYGSGGC